MATFAYEALREPGEPVKGEIEAADEHSAAAALLDRGYHVLTIADANALAARRLKPRLGLWGGLKRRDLVRFTRELASLLKAGLPLSRALSTLRSRADQPGWRGVLGGIGARLEDGRTFSEALAAYPDIYDSMYVNLVHAGEESGTLVGVLTRLAELGEKRDEIYARVKMAMVYPAVMLAVGVVTVSVMVTLVVPMFIDVFKETDQTLPLPTRMLVWLSDFAVSWWWAVLLGIAALSFGLVHYARSERGQRFMGALSLRVPLLGRLARKTAIAAFSRTLGTLLGTGIPIVNALAITASTLRNGSYGDSVRAMANTVRDGDLLSHAIEGSPLFPEAIANVVAVGEHSGDLPDTLQQLADEGERDIDREVKVVMTLLEPIMIVLLGTIVGFIVLAMLLPIFNLGDAIEL